MVTFSLDNSVVSLPIIGNYIPFARQTLPRGLAEETVHGKSLQSLYANSDQLLRERGGLQFSGRYQYGYEGHTLTIHKYSPGQKARQ